MGEAKLVDADTGDPFTMSDVFFNLHHYCNLEKWQVRSYTYPQIQELLKQCGKHIQFVVETHMGPFRAMFGGGGETSGEPKSSVSDDADYNELDEDGVSMLAQMFAGG